MSASKANEHVRESVSTGTPMTRDYILRAIAAEDEDAAIASFVSGNDFVTALAAYPGSFVDLFEVFGEQANTIEFYLWAEDFGGQAVVQGTDTCGFEVLAYRDGGKDPTYMLKCNAGNGKSGTMEALNPSGVATDDLTSGQAYWIHEITYSYKDWPGGVIITDSGNNLRAKTSLDIRGYRYLFFRVNKSRGADANETPAIGVVGHVL